MPDHPWNNPGHEWEDTHVPDRKTLDFVRRYPYYSGTAAQYQEEHASQYGETERLAPNGSHIKADGSHEPKPRFPRGSSRERDHKVYKKSTAPSNRTQRAYEIANHDETHQFSCLDQEQQEYYKHTSGGLTPRAHARLIPSARRFDELSNSNANGRLEFLDKHSRVAYHTLEDDKKHRDGAATAVNEHTIAHQARLLHNKYRAGPHDPKRLDCYSNDPVWNHREHTRSRSHGLPPENTYCSRERTPSPSGSESENNEPRSSSDQQRRKPAPVGKRRRPRSLLLMGNPHPHGGREYSRR